MYKIGELSKLSMLPVKTLRYYDEEGLLEPDYVDQFTGYRYYSASRLNDCYRILILKELGFTLQEIKAQLKLKNKEDISGLLDKKEQELKSVSEQIATQIEKLSFLREKLFRESGKMYHVVIRDADSFRIASVRKIFRNKEETLGLLRKLKQEIPLSVHGKRAVIINYETEFTENDLDLAVGLELTGKIPAAMKVREEVIAITEKTATVVTTMEEIEQGYSALQEFLQENNCQIIGPYYEIMYEDRTVEIKVPVCLLAKSYLPHFDDVKGMFENDQSMIGHWEYVDSVPSYEQFNPLKPKNSIKPWLEELYLLPEGKQYWGISWTKGYLLLHFPDNRYKNPCRIQKIDGVDYLIISLKSFEYEPHNGKPVIWIFRKTDSKAYTIDDIRTRDQVDFPFESDPSVLGIWKAVDLTKTVEEFDPENPKVRPEELYYQSVEFLENGKALSGFRNVKSRYTLEWTKGMLLDHYHELAEHYQIRNIEKTDYLFVEWKSGDYQFGHRQPSYYVFTRHI